MQQSDADGYPEKVPITYYPPSTQETFIQNEKQIKDKPYAKYFHRELYLYADVLQHIREKMPTEAILPREEARRLLEPGYHKYENGWCALADGTAYVTSRPRFPGATGDMVRWWFWWHTVEPERYALWFLYDHVGTQSTYADRLHRTDLTDTQKWVGSTQRVTEFIGAAKITTTSTSWTRHATACRGGSSRRQATRPRHAPNCGTAV